MKKILIALLALAATTANAQQFMRIWSGGTQTQVMLPNAGEMPVKNGSSITIAGNTYQFAAIDSITFGARVKVDYSGTSAKVEIPKMARGVTSQVNGADVVITNTNAQEELEFILSGASQNGSFTYNGTYKTTIILNGLNLKSGTTAALNILCGKRIDLIMTDGTDNMLEDCAGGQQKAALYCKGHLELAGAGNLTVKGNSAHGIGTKEYFIVKRSVKSLKVTGATKDAMHIGQYYEQRGGDVTITGNAGDALQVEACADDAGVWDPTKEFNGQCFIKGGSLTASATKDDTHVLKVDGDITISGGTISFNATGAGSRCIDANANMTINEDDTKTSITLAASGNKYDDGSGDTSRSRLGKIDKDLRMTAGTVKGTVSGKAKGFKIDGKFYKLGGTFNADYEAAGGVVTK